MRWTWCGVAALIGVILAVARVALAQEAPKYDDLKKQYDAAIANLKAAQDAKNGLAAKNEELTKQVESLSKQLGEVMKERDELARQAAAYAERTYDLRSNLAAWQEFMKRYPTLHARWKVFLETELLKSPTEPPSLAEPTWPFRVAG
jgi:septal ring factor EnvC (AmiA/AmiB activator)